MTSFVSLEPEDRRELLRTYGQRFNLNVLVETGTNEGKTPWALQDNFAEIHTIELHDVLWAAADAMFSHVASVHCHHGDSADVLPGVLAELTEPALFWLDGHYSGPGTGHGKDSSPIREELRLILGDARPHVILVDDARIFDGGPEHTLYPHYLEYPKLTWVQKYASGFRYSYELADDIIRLTP